MGSGLAGPFRSYPRLTCVAADEPKKDQDRAGCPPLESATTSRFGPVFQANCQGCHQPAKAGGGYVMTAFDRLLKGGESDDRGDRPRQTGGKPSRRADHAQGRQGRDAAEQAAAVGR